MPNLLERKKITTISLELLISLPFIWLFTGMYLTSGASRILITLTVISLISYFIKQRKVTIPASVDHKWIVFLFFYCALLTISYLTYGASNGELRVSLSLLALIIFIDRNTINFNFFSLLLFLGGLWSFSNAIYFYDQGRMAWPINPIQYATYTASLCTLSLIIVLKHTNTKLRCLSLMTILLSGAATVMSDTRSAWIALLITITLILIYIYKKNKKTLLLCFLLFLPLTYLTSQTSLVQSRLHSTLLEINKIKNNNLNTSIGLRFEIWKAGLYLFKDNPLLGVGKEYREPVKKLASAGLIIPQFKTFDMSSFHNDTLQTLVQYGIVGFTLFCLFFFYPAYRFFQNRSVENLLCIAIFFIYFISGLSYVAIRENQTLGIFIVIIFILMDRKDFIATKT